jgi:hypothetical protein
MTSMTEPRLLLDPAHPLAPKYWVYETGGALALAVMTYLRGDPMSQEDIALLRSYLGQWVSSPVWGPTPHLERLQLEVKAIGTRQQLRTWLETALEDGIDPL